jgi:hypothetical protein
MAPTSTVAARPSRTARVRAAHGAPGVLRLPLLAIAALAAFVALPNVRANQWLLWSILGASGALLAGLALLWVRAKNRPLRVERSLRPQHYLQACAQGTVLLYWGWYWRPVYEFLPLIAAQLVFAYAFDMLLAWSRRDDSDPFPSSSASTCSSGSSRTGSTCSS